jgi:hypothetical protein
MNDILKEKMYKTQQKELFVHHKPQAGISISAILKDNTLRIFYPDV